MVYVTAQGGEKNVGARCSVPLRSQKNRSIRVKIRRGGSRAAPTPRLYFGLQGEIKSLSSSMIRRDTQIGRLYEVNQNMFFPADFILSSPQGVSKGKIGRIPLSPI